MVLLASIATLRPVFEYCVVQLRAPLTTTGVVVTRLHTPAAHVVVPVQAWPQLPQSALLVLVLTHVVPQRVSPAGQTHVPARHDAPAEQAVPHAPQLLGSSAVFVQLLPQSFWLAGHAQCPPEHASPPVQATPHPPQLALSSASFAQ